MAILDSWAVGATADRKVGTEDARRAIGALWVPGTNAYNVQSGLRVAPGDPGKVAATGTPGPNVTCTALQAILDLAARPGAYIATMDATLTIDVLGANPADPSNQRNDLIIAQQNDADYGDANRSLQVIPITGTPSGSPVDPSVPGSANYITLARIRVTAGATTITNAMIDDLRPAWIVALGGIKPVRTSTERTALTPYDGMPIYRQDRDWVEVYDGTAWRVQGIAICSSTADRDSAITSPYNGQLAYTSDTGKVWQRHSGAWRSWPTGLIAQYRQTAAQAALTSGVATDILFDTEDRDNLNAHSTVSNTARFTAPFDATFVFSGGIVIAANATGTRACHWAKNGTGLAGSDNNAVTVGAGAATRVAAKRYAVDMIAGDYVTLQGFQDSGTGLATVVSGTVACSMTVEFGGN